MWLKTILGGKVGKTTSIPQGVFSVMSIAFSDQKLRGEQRREIIQAVQKQMQAEVIEAVRRVTAQYLEMEVTAKLG